MTASASPASTNAVRTLDGLDPRALPDEVLQSTEPLLLRGLVADWPLVAAARDSDAAAMAYLRSFDRGAPLVVLVGTPDMGGRFFYNEDLSGFNFKPKQAKLDTVLKELARHAHDPKPPGIYIGSTTIDTCLPGLRQANDLDLGARLPLASIWIGNRSRIAAHQDLPDNIACVVAGHRRFTLFPPSQLPNLYIGPIDFTPAGQAISLVDFSNPDLERFPRFAEAMANARVLELGPGDAVFIPSLWWHHIEALDSFNILVNYWWRQVPEYMDSPMSALMLAIMSVRDLPAEQRAAWHDIFQHYVFAPDERTAAHIPEAARRLLSPLTPDLARDLRARLLKRLNR